MKLEIRWHSMTPSAELLTHVKEGMAAWARPHPWVMRPRVSLWQEGAWARCRIEVGVAGGAVRVLEAESDDLWCAIDAALERLPGALDGRARPPEDRRAA